MSTPDRRGMLDRADQALSIRRQCMLLGIARSGVYRPPRPANDNDLALMRPLGSVKNASISTRCWIGVGFGSVAAFSAAVRQAVTSTC